MDALHSQFQGSLVTAFEEILDKMAFMVFEPGAFDPEQPPVFAYSSKIAFSGRLAGKLVVYFTESSADEFARNLIGIRKEDALRRETLEDALREFGNILLGRTLSLLAPQEHFDLQLPSTEAGVQPGLTTPTFSLIGMLNEKEPCVIEVTLMTA
jgi:CheY-specific phosphatase CheX